MKIFITGATGLLGKHVVRAALAQDNRVVALARTPPHDAGSNPRLDWVRGDLLRPADYAERLDACDVVLHLAAIYREFVDGTASEELLTRTNVEGSVALFDEARRQAVRRFVFVSSAGVVASTRTDRAKEETPIDPSTLGYFRSKALAERELRARASSGEQPALVIVRPSMMLGPEDGGPTPAGAWVRGFLRREHEILPPVNLVLSDARDVAEAVLQAGTREHVSPLYLLGGQDLSFAELAAELESVSGVPGPRRRPPYPLAWVVSWLRSFGQKPVRGPSPRELAQMRRLGSPRSDLAAAELGYSSRAWRDTIRDAVAWFSLGEPNGEKT